MCFALDKNITSSSLCLSPSLWQQLHTFPQKSELSSSKLPIENLAVFIEKLSSAATSVAYPFCKGKVVLGRKD